MTTRVDRLKCRRHSLGEREPIMVVVIGQDGRAEVKSAEGPWEVVDYSRKMVLVTSYVYPWTRERIRVGRFHCTVPPFILKLP